MIAAAAMVVGVGLFGTFTGLVASWFLAPGEQEQEDELEAIRRQLATIQAQLETLAAAQGNEKRAAAKP